jgi:Rap1a immunity proteins
MIRLKKLGHIQLRVADLERSKAFYRDVTRCLRKGITYGQITAIVQKYMENNPSQWHYDMASLTWNAVNEACAPASK